MNLTNTLLGSGWKIRTIIVAVYSVSEFLVLEIRVAKMLPFHTPLEHIFWSQSYLHWCERWEKSRYRDVVSRPRQLRRTARNWFSFVREVSRGERQDIVLAWLKELVFAERSTWGYHYIHYLECDFLEWLYSFPAKTDEDMSSIYAFMARLKSSLKAGRS